MKKGRGGASLKGGLHVDRRVRTTLNVGDILLRVGGVPLEAVLVSAGVSGDDGAAAICGKVIAFIKTQMQSGPPTTFTFAGVRPVGWTVAAAASAAATASKK